MNRMFTSKAYWSFALERGDWDTIWYCIDCYMRYYIYSIACAAKKALYDHGENQNVIRDNVSTSAAEAGRAALYSLEQALSRCLLCARVAAARRRRHADWNM